MVVIVVDFILREKVTYLVVHLYCVIFLGFKADQKDFVAENPTGIRA